MGFASQQARLTASGVVGTEDKRTYLLSVVVEGTGTATFRNGDDDTDPIQLLITSGSWTAGSERGVAYPAGLRYTKGAETSVSVEYTQDP